MSRVSKHISPAKAQFVNTIYENIVSHCPSLLSGEVISDSLNANSNICSEQFCTESVSMTSLCAHPNSESHFQVYNLPHCLSLWMLQFAWEKRSQEEISCGAIYSALLHCARQGRRRRTKLKISTKKRSRRKTWKQWWSTESVTTVIRLNEEMNAQWALLIEDRIIEDRMSGKVCSLI